MSQIHKYAPTDGRAVIKRYAGFVLLIFLFIKLAIQFLVFPAILFAVPEELSGVIWHGNFLLGAVVLLVVHWLAQVASSITSATLAFLRYHVYHSGGRCADGGDHVPNCPMIREQNKHWFYRGFCSAIYIGWFTVFFAQVPSLFTELTLTEGSLRFVAFYNLAAVAVSYALNVCYQAFLRKHLGYTLLADKEEEAKEAPLAMDHPAVVACERRLKTLAAVPGMSKLNWLLRGLRPKLDATKLSPVHECEELESKVGLKVNRVRQPFERNGLRVTPASPQLATACAPVLKGELELYPSGFFSTIHFKQVILGAKLSSEKEELPGFADVESESLCLSIPEDCAELWFRKQLHHEIFHFIDFHDDLEGLNDHAWDRMNQSTGSGDKLPAFSAHEDKAELFSSMITSYNEVASLAKDDKLLSHKLERMKKILRKVDARFDNEFWQRRAEASASEE